MAGENMEVEASSSNPSDEIRKMKIQFLKAVLNIYRARSLSLSSACETRRSHVTIPDYMKKYEFLREQIHGLQNDITLLQTLQKTVDILHNTITCSGAVYLNDPQQRRELERAVSEISFLSQFVMKMYNEKLNEIEHIRQKQDYMTTIGNYTNMLETMKEKQKHMAHSDEDLRRLQKAEMQVTKINFIRQMKLIFLSSLAKESEKHPHLQQFRTAFRKNLTVEDFSETWDVGL
ncbi:UNVERIFIED_CONTAM: hypothetical protein PYX00_008621 [Menopon gallinae]|uniref:Uncharacterized protein n=1 Tax=Menopon gallinae TaxID=328185 RepID=A0AAW2HNJ8_9NEOP